MNDTVIVMLVLSPFISLIANCIMVGHIRWLQRQLTLATTTVTPPLPEQPQVDLPPPPPTKSPTCTHAPTSYPRQQLHAIFSRWLVLAAGHYPMHYPSYCDIRLSPDEERELKRALDSYILGGILPDAESPHYVVGELYQWLACGTRANVLCAKQVGIRKLMQRIYNEYYLSNMDYTDIAALIYPAEKMFSYNEICLYAIVVLNRSRIPLNDLYRHQAIADLVDASPDDLKRACELWDATYKTKNRSN